MTAPLWSLEWRLARRRRRLCRLNTAIPLLLVAPLAVSDAPAFHAAAAYTVLFVLFGTFGSAIPLLREAEEGLLRRFLLAGASERAILVQRAAAAACIDVLQLAPATAVILLAGGGGAPLWALTFGVLLPSLLVANLVGIWVAAAARSLAEGALFAAVTGLFLLHGSGVFRSPAPGTLGALAERLLPFSPLHDVALAAAGGGAVPSGPWLAVIHPLLAALALLLVTLLVAGFLVARIAPPVPR